MLDNKNPQITAAGALFALALALSPLLYMGSLLQPSDLPRYFLTAILAAASLVLGILVYKWPKAGIKWDIWHTSVLLVLAFTALSVTWSPDPDGGKLTFLQLAAAAICAFAASQFATDSRFLRPIVAASVAGGAVAALIGILQNHGVTLPYEQIMVGSSTFHYKNHAALYLDLIAPVSVGLVFVVEKRGLQWLAAFAAALIVGYLVMSRTRGSWLSLMVIVFVALWLLRRSVRKTIGAIEERKWPVLVAVVIAATVAINPGQIGKVWDRSAKPTEKVDLSTGIRLAMYHDSLSIVGEHPLAGAGIDGFGESIRYHYDALSKLPVPTDAHEQRLHNDVLQWIVELGVPFGLLAIFAMCYPIYRAIPLTTISPEGDHEHLMVIVIGLGLLASFVHSLVDFPLHKPSSLLQYAVWSGIVIGYTMKTPVQKRPVFTSLLLGTCGLIAVFSLLQFPRYFEGSALTRTAIGSTHAGAIRYPCDRGVKDIDRAVRLFPEYFATHIWRVRVYSACVQDPQTLIAVTSEEIVQNPTHTEAMRLRARAHLALGMIGEAENDYLANLRLFPFEIRAHRELASMYRALGDVEAAKREEDLIKRFSIPH